MSSSETTATSLLSQKKECCNFWLTGVKNNSMIYVVANSGGHTGGDTHDLYLKNSFLTQEKGG
jgi:hypothetical protein